MINEATNAPFNLLHTGIPTAPETKEEILHQPHIEPDPTKPPTFSAEEISALLGENSSSKAELEKRLEADPLFSSESLGAMSLLIPDAIIHFFLPEEKTILSRDFITSRLMDFNPEFRNLFFRFRLLGRRIYINFPMEFPFTESMNLLKSKGAELATKLKNGPIKIINARDYLFFRISLRGFSPNSTRDFIIRWFIVTGFPIDFLTKIIVGSNPITKSGLSGSLELLYSRIPAKLWKWIHVSPNGESIKCKMVNVHWNPLAPPKEYQRTCRFCNQNHMEHMCYLRTIDERRTQLTDKEKMFDPSTTPNFQFHHIQWLSNVPPPPAIFENIFSNAETTSDFTPINEVPPPTSRKRKNEDTEIHKVPHDRSKEKKNKDREEEGLRIS